MVVMAEVNILELPHQKNRFPEFASIGTNNALKSRLYMKDNSKCI